MASLIFTLYLSPASRLENMHESEIKAIRKVIDYKQGNLPVHAVDCPSSIIHT